jgi:translation initiation factor IF-2
VAKKRVHEIAKEMEVTSKEILRACERLDIDAKSHSSSVSADEEKQLRDFFKQKASGTAKALPKDFLGDEKKRKRVVRLRRKTKTATEEPELSGIISEESAPVETAEPETTAATQSEPETTAPVEEPGDAAQAEEIEATTEEKTEKKKPKEKRKKKPKVIERPKTTAKIIGQIDLPETQEPKEKAEVPRRRKKKKGRHAEETIETPKRRRRRLPRAPKREERRRAKRRPSTLPPKEKKVIPKKVTVTGAELAAEFAHRTVESYEAVEEKLLELGYESVSRTKLLTPDDLEALIEEMGFELVEGKPEKKSKPRPPVVAVLGHVDHGKTTLLDAIRKTDVVSSESGGITQHIGASSVETPNGRVTFLDTPGHELFTALRARGAEITDIVVLVVAADDGVMPQTVEAINHARAAGVPIVVAITKIDLPGADPTRVRNELAAQGIAVEELGGDVLAVDVAAPKELGLKELMDAILLQAEVMELEADHAARGSGVVIESRIDKGRGPVITLLVNEGIVRTGDSFIAGSVAGKIRAMTDGKGNKLKEAFPSDAVEIIGCEGIPEGGNLFAIVPDYKLARQITDDIASAEREVFREEDVFTLDDWFTRLKEGEKNELYLILKADVAGSVEALKEAVENLGDEEVGTKVLHAAPGPISENDVLLASASKAIIIGFHVGADGKAKKLGEQEGVEIRLYTVIYEAIADITAALEGLLEPEVVLEIVGEVEVRQVFAAPGGVRIAGCFVKSGRVFRGARVKVYREDEEMHEGKVASLRRFADDAREVTQGLECGLTVEGFNEFKAGDYITVVEEKKVARRLSAV